MGYKGSSTQCCCCNGHGCWHGACCCCFSYVQVQERLTHFVVVVRGTIGPAAAKPYVLNRSASACSCACHHQTALLCVQPPCQHARTQASQPASPPPNHVVNCMRKPRTSLLSRSSDEQADPHSQQARHTCQGGLGGGWAGICKSQARIARRHSQLQLHLGEPLLQAAVTAHAEVRTQAGAATART